MAITSTGQNAATTTATSAAAPAKDKSILGKDDFMKLLLVELQYQDPTAPMDTEKILTQTSQLAGLESADNTNTALSNLAATLGGTQQFSTIAAIGKRADLGSDAVAHDEGKTTSFEVYFPEDIDHGTVAITDAQDKTIATLDIKIDPTLGKKAAGVYQFDWDGLDSSGKPATSGIYHVNSNYVDTSGVSQETRIGSYPIESVRFQDGKTLLKLGSNYVPLENVTEVY